MHSVYSEVILGPEVAKGDILAKSLRRLRSLFQR
jgi:hypothetical protein